MRANIGHRSTDIVTKRRAGIPRPSAFQSKVLEYMAEHGDGHGAVIAGNYYTEGSVRTDAALADHLYWTLGGDL